MANGILKHLTGPRRTITHLFGLLFALFCGCCCNLFSFISVYGIHAYHIRDVWLLFDKMVVSHLENIQHLNECNNRNCFVFVCFHFECMCLL